MITSSAPRDATFASIRALEPGTVRHVRRDLAGIGETLTLSLGS
jgi:hypothetical protein